MSNGETHHVDKKSLRLLGAGHPDWSALAADCVCFANGAGGQLLVGIENDSDGPPPGQRIDAALTDRIRKRVGELTVNVTVHPELQRHDNDGDYIVVRVDRALGVASTSDGRYFLRVGDTCQPVVGDDVLRLASERPTVPWETLTHLDVRRADVDGSKVASLLGRLRSSDRVKASVKEKSDEELLDHYALARGPLLTNLGVLLVGAAADRARLGTAPIVQAIRYDERGAKIGKDAFDDHTLSPIDLVDAVWAAVPDFRERYELPDGLFRTSVPAFDDALVRELLVNALVHRPYTQRGDVFVNVHPDRLEVVNPGRLPLGVTPRNILHASRRRNDGLARIFHDVKLMEREGSGFDLMFELLLSSGRGAPTVVEGTDSVHVTVPRRVVHRGVIALVAAADRHHQLTQRERIALGLLAQSEGLSATALVEALELDDVAQLHSWLDRLTRLGLVEQMGRGRGMRYYVPPELLRGAGLDERTTLSRVEPHRLRALILEDLERYPKSSSTDIRRRTGPEIPLRTFRRTLEEMVTAGQVEASGEKRWRRYRLTSNGQGDPRGR